MVDAELARATWGDEAFAEAVRNYAAMVDWVGHGYHPDTPVEDLARPGTALFVRIHEARRDAVRFGFDEYAVSLRMLE